MSRIAWARAATLVGALYMDRPDDWPRRLAPAHLAQLQSPPKGKDWTDTTAVRKAIEAACTHGELAHAVEAFTVPPPVVVAYIDDSPGAAAARYRSQATTNDWPAILAADFLTWLQRERTQPSEHIRAWAEATGARTAAPVAPRPIPRQAAHEAAIVAALVRRGFNPMRLPCAPPGQPSQAKAAARGELPKMSPAVFDKAWLRLRRGGRIADA